MDENNIFNSFSFKKWADYVKHEKIEDEILRQRMDQVSRLRLKLIRERQLRDQADVLSDEDIDKLIGYINAGYSLSGGGGGGGGGYYGGGQGGSRSQRFSERVETYIPKDDDYIFNEIRNFYTANNQSLRGLKGTLPSKFQHNHRYANGIPKANAMNSESKSSHFEYNRRYNQQQ